jgi:hypothetical protein
MNIKTIVKWAFLPVLVSICWITFQSFSKAGKAMQLSYEVTTTTFTSVLRLQDTSKLTTFEKINTMVYKDQVKNVATMDAAGDFNIVITRTARPSLGGNPLPLDDVSEVTVTPRGISTNTGETYPFEPDEYQNMVSTAKTLSNVTTNCASRAADITALANALTAAGAVKSILNGFTVFRQGNIETVLDMKNYIYVAQWTRQNGKLIKEIQYDYDIPPIKTGDNSGDGGCPILKRITTREEIKSSANVPLLQVEIHDISNVTVVNR